jgi:hypothetical protein
LGRDDGVGADLTAKLAFLVRRSWGACEHNQPGGFVFDARLAPPGSLEPFVAALLRHIRAVAPALSVPFMTPRIEIAQMIDACGRFVEDDGWVKFVLRADFAVDIAASRAILCHEVCHYVLGANGIRFSDRHDNERLTDVAMFVFGLGAIFESGFRSTGAAISRRGYRMGYLTDAEYQFLSREVVRLRVTGELQTPDIHALQGKLLNRLGGNRAMLERYLAHARQRFPNKSETERIQGLLDDFDRGR